ncbi:unnamed protein product [marine sediment metagenome]|uniref:Uncharacterized protein n=1 Tax=marine sediment metagenome TaxID=412755 RepID=X1I0T4_9ZZZZ
MKEAGVLEQVEPLALAIEVTKEKVGEDLKIIKNKHFLCGVFFIK